jgi:hypothetical protein
VDVLFVSDKLLTKLLRFETFHSFNFATSVKKKKNLNDPFVNYIIIKVGVPYFIINFGPLCVLVDSILLVSRIYLSAHMQFTRNTQHGLVKYNSTADAFLKTLPSNMDSCSNYFARVAIVVTMTSQH